MMSLSELQHACKSTSGILAGECKGRVMSPKKLLEAPEMFAVQVGWDFDSKGPRLATPDILGCVFAKMSKVRTASAGHRRQVLEGLHALCLKAWLGHCLKHCEPEGACLSSMMSC